MRIPSVVVSVLLAGVMASAEPSTQVEGEIGTLNPDDDGREMLMRKIEMGMVDSVTCSLAFNSSKYDDLEMARRVATLCAEGGLTKAMTWISQMDSNGQGADYDPDAAAEWDRRAAEAGDPVGRFNHGLNLMRGLGISQDDALGRSFVDQAAKDGLEIARRLQSADYDLDAVTPDADNWRYAPMF